MLNPSEELSDDDKPVERRIRSSEPFRTPDLYQAAFLLARGRKIVRIDRRERYRFTFERTPALGKDLADFDANAPVGVKDLVFGVYKLKRVMRWEDLRQ